MLDQQECDVIVRDMLADPMAFLGKTIISLYSDPVDAHDKTPAPVRFSLNRSSKSTTNATVYATTDLLRDAPVITTGLPMYFLPWARKRKLSIMLPPSGETVLFFTANLTGCAVGYWRAPDGGVKFYHVNIGGEGSIDATGTAAHEKLTKALTKTHSKSGHVKSPERKAGGIFNVNDYGWGESKVIRGCACGVRRQQGWEFYGQTIVEFGLRGGFGVKDVRPF